MTNDPSSQFPNDEKMYSEIGKSLDKVGLNSEVLVTIIKEVARISQNANHEQIHVLTEIMQAILASLAFAHYVIVKREGRSEHGFPE